MRRLRVAAIVPTLEEADRIDTVLDSLRGFDEVVVVDGGSRDTTRARAAAHRLAPRVLIAAGGRAAQCNAGAAATRSDVLVFVHADSRLPAGAAATLRAADRAAVGGNFALRFDGEDGFARVLGAVYAVQRRLGFYYGDSSIWCRRRVFTALNGFRDLPVMDDYDFARRLERSGRTLTLPGPALTSDRRWRALGVPRTLVAWVAIRWLYVLGVPSSTLARLYRRVR